jgi:signal transduction histidine kinase
LIETPLSADVQAAVTYRLALSLASESRLAEAASTFRTIYQKFPQSVGETGLPLAPLAGLKAMELPEPPADKSWARPLSWEILCNAAINNPSSMTPVVLERAERAGVLAASRLGELREQWQTQETLRELYRASRHELRSSSPAPLFWIHSAGQRWLGSHVDEFAANHWIVCRKIAFEKLAPSGARAEVRAMRVTMGPDLKLIPGIGGPHRAPTSPAQSFQSPASLPDYLGMSVIAADEPIVALTNMPVLATATHNENGRELLKVSLHLTNPQLLYARQKQRVLWFGLLIGVSTLAAITGLVSAWRSFEKQQRLAELKDNFVSSVSHELRAPIASVRLMAEGLERGRVQEPEKQREYFRFILQECRRLSALIQNVLDFSRIDQGGKEYEFEPADVLRLANETVKAMEPAAAERQIRLRFTPPASSVTATIDARAIQQALVNLIDNAIKHSPAGSEIMVGVNVLPPRRLLQISVEDRGEGIPATEHERIFERFYRVGSELRRQTPGAGIGLSIVKHIVDAHDGRVRVESEPGKGSRFTIEIPLKG